MNAALDVIWHVIWQRPRREHGREPQLCEEAEMGQERGTALLQVIE